MGTRNKVEDGWLGLGILAATYVGSAPALWVRILTCLKIHNKSAIQVSVLGFGHKNKITKKDYREKERRGEWVKDRERQARRDRYRCWR